MLHGALYKRPGGLSTEETIQLIIVSKYINDVETVFTGFYQITGSQDGTFPER
jgi:hypothetical protein